MLKPILIALFLALPFSAGAATFDVCDQLAMQFKLAAENRDKGVPLTKSISNLIYPDTADDEAAAQIKAITWIYKERAYSPAFFETVARDTCNAS